MRFILLSFSFFSLNAMLSQDCSFIAVESQTAVCGENVHLETLFTENTHAMYFNGSSSRLEAPDRPEYHLEGQDFTLTAWIKLLDHNGRFDIISKPSSTWASHGAYDLYLENGALKFTIRHEFGAPWYHHLTGPIVPSGEWHHVAAVADRAQGEMRLYIDGVEVASRDWVGTLFMNSQLPLYIGCHYKEDYPGQYFGHFRGRMDDLSIWKKSLGEAELSQLMLCPGSMLQDSALVSFWDFHEGGGQFSTDLSSHGHQATLLFSSAFVAESPYGKGPFTVTWSTGDIGETLDISMDSDMHITAIATDIQGHDRLDEIFIENVPDGFTQVSVHVCPGESYLFPDGYLLNDILSPTSYFSEIQTASGCDSAVMTMVIPTQIDASISIGIWTLSCTNLGDSYQWFKCGALSDTIMEANSYSYDPLTSGDYRVEIVKNGCTVSSECIHFELPVILGLSESEQHSVSLYPNPNNGSFTVDLQQISGADVILILDLEGRVVSKIPITVLEKIPLHLTLEAGSYLIMLQGNGSVLHTRRFVIMH